MRAVRKIIVLVTLLLAAVVPTRASTNPVGELLLVQGDVRITSKGLEREGARGVEVYLSDQIATESNSRTLLRFNDGTRIWLAENSIFEIVTFDPNSSSPEARFTLLKGALRTLTGLITKRDDAIFEIETPLATMGVRGTDFWGGFFTPDKFEVTLFEGSDVYVVNALGRVLLQVPGEGTSVQAGMPPEPVKTWGQAKIDRAKMLTEIQP